MMSAGSIRRLFLLGAVLTLGPVPALAAEPAAGQAILDAHSYWRCLFLSASPVVRANGKLTAVDPQKAEVPAPPADWTKPEFDDLAWVRLTGPFFPSSGHAYCRQVDGAGYTWFERSGTDLATICLRGRFAVADPAAVRELRLDLAYRGGVVVHLNGREVARKHLPAGALEAASVAEDYPPEAFVRPDGAVIRWGFGDPEKYADRLAMRVRRAEGISLPADALRKGVNVLAVEIRRAPYHEVVLLGGKKTFYGGANDRGGGQLASAWTTAGMVDLSLRSAGSGAVPGTGRPKGLVVWNANPMQAVLDADCGDTGVAPGPIRLAGTRGGAFSGQVVVSSDAAIRDLKAAASELKQDGGAGVIPATAIQVRYAQPGDVEMGNEGRFRGGVRDVRRFDALEEAPPAEVPLRPKPVARGSAPDPGGAVQPVWVTVNVPGDAPAGLYRGKLALEAAGQKFEVPVELSVAGWRLPEPKDYVTIVDFIQSPDSVALQYGVEPWSEKHWELIGRSFRLIGELGNKTLYVPLICRTHFGNPESMVRWVRRKDGGHELDFSRVEKYLDTAAAAGVRPRVVILDVVEWYVGPKGSWGKGEQDPLKWQAPLVTEYDPETKTAKEMDAPKFATPEARKFWEPVFAGLRERLAKRGLDKTMMIGVKTDFSWVPKQIAGFFKEVAPGVPWVDQGHGPDKAVDGVPVGYATSVWGASMAKDPANGRTYGWQNPWLVTHYHRDLVPRWPLTEFRLTAERNIAGKQRGIGRLGADFWPVLGDRPGRKLSIAGRYPEGQAGQLGIKLAFLAPGKDGAISTVRLEMMREGVQECEARIFIEKALLDAGARSKLGEELAGRCQETLDERTRALRFQGAVQGYHQFVGSDWQARSGKLYAAAAEVAAKLGGK